MSGYEQVPSCQRYMTKTTTTTIRLRPRPYDHDHDHDRDHDHDHNNDHFILEGPYHHRSIAIPFRVDQCWLAKTFQFIKTFIYVILQLNFIAFCRLDVDLLHFSIYAPLFLFIYHEGCTAE